MNFDTNKFSGTARVMKTHNIITTHTYNDKIRSHHMEYYLKQRIMRKRINKYCANEKQAECYKYSMNVMNH